MSNCRWTLASDGSVRDEEVAAHVCVLTLGYSRRIFATAYACERQAQCLEGIEAAFRHFGGTPAELLVDNARALVTHHDPATREVTFNETFRRFCEHWGVRPRACAPYRARTKGKDERAVQYVPSHRFLPIRPYGYPRAGSPHLAGSPCLSAPTTLAPLGDGGRPAWDAGREECVRRDTPGEILHAG